MVNESIAISDATSALSCQAMGYSQFLVNTSGKIEDYAFPRAIFGC
jgi:hypothetical protein